MLMAAATLPLFTWTVLPACLPACCLGAHCRMGMQPNARPGRAGMAAMPGMTMPLAMPMASAKRGAQLESASCSCLHSHWLPVRRLAPAARMLLPPAPNTGALAGPLLQQFAGRPPDVRSGYQPAIYHPPNRVC
jgi:hypothetical protein